LTYRDAVKILGAGQSPLVSALDKVFGGLLLGATPLVPDLLSIFDAKSELVRLTHELVAKGVDRRHRLGRATVDQRHWTPTCGSATGTEDDHGDITVRHEIRRSRSYSRAAEDVEDRERTLTGPILYHASNGQTTTRLPLPEVALAAAEATAKIIPRTALRQLGHVSGPSPAIVDGREAEEMIPDATNPRSKRSSTWGVGCAIRDSNPEPVG
jgi:hypothetical protein